MKKTSDVNPIEFEYQDLVKWAEQYVEEQESWGGILTDPSPRLLTTLYAELVVEKDILASEWNVLAAKRHLKDLKRSKDPDYPWEFDEEKAWRPIRFIEKKCKPSKGEAKQLVMQPWQHFVIGNMFGWVSKKTGLRRFREGLVFVGRKNGKRLAVLKLGEIGRNLLSI